MFEQQKIITESKKKFHVWNTDSLICRFGVYSLQFSYNSFSCCCLVTKSNLTFCDPMDCSPPGFYVQGVSQARILDWVAISLSQGSSQPRNQTQVSCTVGGFFTDWATRVDLIPRSTKNNRAYFNLVRKLRSLKLTQRIVLGGSCLVVRSSKQSLIADLI